MEKRVIDVFKSKRFWVMVISVAVMLLIAVEPRFAGSEDQLINNITFIALLLIGGYSVQDVALAWLAQPGNIKLVGEAFQKGVDEAERVFKVDVPDSLEPPLRHELEKQLQELVDQFSARRSL